METLAARAAKNVGDTVRLAIKLPAERTALVVFDLQTPFSRLLAKAYRDALPGGVFLDFDEAGPAGTMAAIDRLAAGDLVVLVQSTGFRLDEFRIRIELFKRGLATIDHGHLERETTEAQMSIYVDALAYDPGYYRPLGRSLKAKLDAARQVVVRCPGTTLTYEGGMEEAKLNVGDYEGMKNVGGTFPIGEVFSEPKDLTKVEGQAVIFAFAGHEHLVRFYEPFRLRIERGLVVGHDGPPEFQAVLDQIRGANEAPMLREFGLGLNPAMGRSAHVPDITAFERQKGLHFSLGEKHGVYKKPGFNPKKTIYHIDVFVDVERIECDGEAIYKEGEFVA